MMRRKRRYTLRGLPRRQRRVVLLVVAMVALLVTHWLTDNQPPPGSLEPGIYHVARVVDGDTLVLTNRARVRLIGADTPETVRPNHPVEPWGREATQFTREFVAGGAVRLQFDGPPKDKYGRFLAHVWVGDRMLEEELIRAGLATATTNYRFSTTTKVRLLAAQTQARAAGRGIWSE